MVGGLIGFPGANQRHMNAHVISAAESLFEAHVLYGRALLLQVLFVPKIHQFLYSLHEAVILIGGIEAPNVHVEAGALADHRLPDASGADYGDRLPCHFVSQKWQKWMPRTPQVLSHLLLARP